MVNSVSGFQIKLKPRSSLSPLKWAYAGDGYNKSAGWYSFRVFNSGTLSFRNLIAINGSLIKFESLLFREHSLKNGAPNACQILPTRLANAPTTPNAHERPIRGMRNFLLPNISVKSFVKMPQR
ncbi:hypothetical protein CDAR_26821 [Caerostris darwini]|uniref:Uncharacterized protein n=1 Tax=Caerostris darwini TaxID=1538125 RepID=A0AAV4TNA3_9ARAC|nr:hypothetical protein CDAR_26821 [Caerostris darwini]